LGVGVVVVDVVVMVVAVAVTVALVVMVDIVVVDRSTAFEFQRWTAVGTLIEVPFWAQFQISSLAAEIIHTQAMSTASSLLQNLA
ncbi:hypothetical protein BBP40_012027, partial [Aspergillus hancockii]